MNTAHNLVRSSVVRTLYAIIAMVVSFFMMPFLVHNLGERWYGIWVLISSLTGSYYLLDLGLAAAVTRFVAKYVATDDYDGVNAVVNTSFWIYSGLSLIIVMISVTLSACAGRFVSDPSQLSIVRLTMLIAGLELAAEFPFKAFAGIIGAYVRYDLLIYSRLVYLVVSTSLVVWFVRRDAGIVALAATSFGCAQLANLYYFAVAKHIFRPLRMARRHVSSVVAKELVGYSIWAFVTQMANQLRFKIDSLVLGGMMSASAVTQYAVGQRLVETFVDLVYRATNMMTPVFTQYWAQERYEKTRETLLLLTRINIILAVFGGGLIVVVGKAFITRWMGADFSVSYPVLVVLMSALVIEVVGCHADNLFFAMSKHHYLAVINILEGLANVALSVALVNRFGIVGAALGTAIPLVFFRLAVIPYYTSRFVGLSLRRYYRNVVPTAVTTVLYLCAYYFLTRRFLAVPSYGRIFVVAILAVPVYGILVPFVAFSKEERRYLLSLIPVRAFRK